MNLLDLFNGSIGLMIMFLGCLAILLLLIIVADTAKEIKEVE